MGSELDFATKESSSQRRTRGRSCWTRHSDELLCNVEKKILSCLKTEYKGFYVDIGPVIGKCDKIWTISLNTESQKTPLVLLHGLGAGLALWCPNLDALAADRPVYAIDLLGFGRSSRPKFSSDALKAEAQWVESVEEWRREVNLAQFVLLGHSLGGYLATAYAIKYPDRVRHLIAADPWGYPERPVDGYEKPPPFWKRAYVTAVQPLNPLWAVRAAGPAGRWLVSKTRPDISRKYQRLLPDADALIPDYIYQCNSQTPSGESAFHTLMDGFVWAKHPMIKRLDQLHPAVPLTDIYGSKSFLQCCTSAEMHEKRPNSKIYTKIIYGATHHVYLDNADIFNKFVLEACATADEYDPQIKSHRITEPSQNAEDNTVRPKNQSPQNIPNNTAELDLSPPGVGLFNQHEEISCL